MHQPLSLNNSALISLQFLERLLKSPSCLKSPVCKSTRLTRSDAQLTPATGVVYEKRLIEQYINEHGTEPDSGEALTADDLLPVHSSRIVRPRPPTLTSIPALLATFQNEWDALALETYNIKEQLARTREELATALYQHDAAVRVIARLTRERDEARDALSKVTVTGVAADGDSMQVDSVEKLPEELVAKVDETHQTYVAIQHIQSSQLTSYSDYQRVARDVPSPRAGLPATRFQLLRARLRTLYLCLMPPPLLSEEPTLLLLEA